jgi:uncharacterized protein
MWITIMDRIRFIALICCIVLWVSLLTAPMVIEAKTKFVTIGTGDITGIYDSAGSAIAKMINAKRDAYGISATVQSSGSSVFNINAVISGDMDFGIAQSDRQYEAVNGLAEWKDQGLQEDLRAVFLQFTRR